MYDQHRIVHTHQTLYENGKLRKETEQKKGNTTTVMVTTTRGTTRTGTRKRRRRRHLRLTQVKLRARRTPSSPRKTRHHAGRKAKLKPKMRNHPQNLRMEGRNMQGPMPL